MFTKKQKEEKKEDDLIILSDDTADEATFWDDSIVTENLDISADITTDNDMISFDEAVVDDKKEAKTEDNSLDLWDLSEKSDDNSEKTEDSLDLWDNDLSLDIIDEPKDKKEEVNLASDTLSLDDTVDDLSSAWNTSLDLQSDDSADVDTILDGTITKLKSRQDVIKSKKWDNSSKITELNKKIKNLETEKKSLESDNTSLTEEDKKINSNITGLEKMKMPKTGGNK